MTRSSTWRTGLLLLLPAVLLGGPSARAQEAPIAFIKVAEVHALMKRGARVHLVDVRSRQEYLARHIKGAASIPLDALEARAAEVPRQGLVVLY
jgi:3-mercaptopyruvate sulfurtransferase SseA